MAHNAGILIFGLLILWSLLVLVVLFNMGKVIKFGGKVKNSIKSKLSTGQRSVLSKAKQVDSEKYRKLLFTYEELSKNNTRGKVLCFRTGEVLDKGEEVSKFWKV